MSSLEEDELGASIRRAIDNLRSPEFWLPLPPVPHPLRTLERVAHEWHLAQWREAEDVAVVSGRAQVVHAPDRVIIIWPNRSTSEVWVNGG